MATPRLRFQSRAKEALNIPNNNSSLSLRVSEVGIRKILANADILLVTNRKERERERGRLSIS